METLKELPNQITSYLISFKYKFDNYLAVREEPERIPYVRTYRSAWTVLYMETFLSFR